MYFDIDQKIIISSTFSGSYDSRYRVFLRQMCAFLAVRFDDFEEVRAANFLNLFFDKILYFLSFC